MIKPMLASPLAKANIHDWNDWRIEEKFDGHRVVVVVNTVVTAYGRPRKHAGSTGKTQEIKTLATHLEDALAQFGPGVYDGELVGGDTSTDVTRLDLRDDLRFVCFDIIEREGCSTASMPYDERRSVLEDVFKRARMVTVRRNGQPYKPVQLAESTPLACQRDVTRFCEQVWKRGGEGAILKRRTSIYQAGKRSPDWVKVKKLQTAVVTVIGFEPSRGTVRFPGHPFAIIVVEDPDGNRTTVKTKDDAELDAFSAAAANIEGTIDHVLRVHPALGRKLRIEYQDRTRDGGYRHPRWDRWEDE